MPQVLTIVGATGTQGGSVTNSALESKAFKVRAVTRNINSEKAKALAARGVEVVAADLDNEQSLIEAFKGSDAIFAVTNFYEPFGSHGPETAMKVEEAQGLHLAKAAAATPTLKHYIWSTLPSATKISSSKYLVPHFDAKNRVNDYIKNDPVLLEKTTFLWVTFYPSNYFFPVFTPNFNKSSGKYIQLQPVPENVPVLSIGDPNTNIGVFVLSIFNQPQLTRGGKFVLASVEESTIGEMLKAWSTVTGRPSAYVPTTLEAMEGVWPMWGYEMGIMMQFWEEYRDASWSGEAEILTKKDLNITEQLIGIKEAFAALDWSNLGTLGLSS